MTIPDPLFADIERVCAAAEEEGWTDTPLFTSALRTILDRAQAVRSAPRPGIVAEAQLEHYVQQGQQANKIHELTTRAEAAVRALAERDQWVADLQSGMYVNCVYCGHRYGPRETTPVSMADALKAHIEECPRHPMSALKRQLAERDAALTALNTNHLQAQGFGPYTIQAIEHSPIRVIEEHAPGEPEVVLHEPTACTCEEHRASGDFPDCPIHVNCDNWCGALRNPLTLADCRLALDHWKSHRWMHGCSHAN